MVPHSLKKKARDSFICWWEHSDEGKLSETIWLTGSPRTGDLAICCSESTVFFRSQVCVRCVIWMDWKPSPQRTFTQPPRRLLSLPVRCEYEPTRRGTPTRRFHGGYSPKANQHQRSVPLLPRPCWGRRTRWLMIQAGKHTERPAGSLEDQFITLYFVWPPPYPQLSWLESCTIHSAQMVWVFYRMLCAHTRTHTSQAKKKKKKNANQFCRGLPSLGVTERKPKFNFHFYFTVWIRFISNNDEDVRLHRCCVYMQPGR